MNDRTKYPRGSPRDILIRLLRQEKETQQLLRDVQSCNDNNPNFKDEPMDVGRYLVRLKNLQSVIAEVRAAIARGDSTLPDGILKSLIEKW